MAVAVVDGAEIAYTDTGSGPVVLFVHGFPLDSTMWTEQVDRLDRHRAVCVDLRGFGRSSPATTDRLTMDRHADDLLGVIDQIGVDRVDLVGLSMGGYVTLAFAELHPERLCSLALIDTKATADTEEGRAGRDQAAARLLDRGRQTFAADMAPTLLAPDAAPWLVARVRQMIESTRYETIVAALAGIRDRPDRSSVLAGLSVPVAVVVGEHDAITPPAAAEAMASLGVGITLDVIPGAGHMSPVEAPDEVAGVLEGLFGRAG